MPPPPLDPDPAARADQVAGVYLALGFLPVCIIREWLRHLPASE